MGVLEMSRQEQNVADNYTPKEYAASMAVDALYFAVSEDRFAPNDSPGYRARVRKQMLKLLAQIAEKANLDYSLPPEQTP
jgi:hypothetical protein